ncbi:la ribonucleoprotein translational regulator Achilles [Rhodnius prolixus]
MTVEKETEGENLEKTVEIQDNGKNEQEKNVDEGAVLNFDDAEDFVTPDEELVQKIVEQVEFYFSDVNITKDAFLLKHVKRNKEGYVSLKLISSFKRVKHLAKDWRVVAYALARSKKLQINEAGTKLRRLDPLPPYDQTTPSRTIVAIDLPVEKPSIETVAELFGNCGEIALIRILRPGNPIPADVRHFVNKHPQMVGKVSALVEFVRTESAHNALNKDWTCRHSNMQVLELNAPPSVERKKKLKKLKSLEDYSTSSCSENDERRNIRLNGGQIRRLSGGLEASHWTQRRYRSNEWEGVNWNNRSFDRRLSSDSLESWNSSRSRSNSGISLSDIRRLSLASSGSDCCSCRHLECRRGSRDSGSEGYCSSRSRCGSGSDSRRSSIDLHLPGKPRENGYWSMSIESGRRGSREGGRIYSNGSADNVVRMPRGPEAGRGFHQPHCHTLVE